MNDVKNFLQSRTIWAAILALAAGGLGLVGYSISEEDRATILELISGIGATVGGFGAIYYRIIASKKIGP